MGSFDRRLQTDAHVPASAFSILEICQESQQPHDMRGHDFSGSYFRDDALCTDVLAVLS